MEEAGLREGMRLVLMTYLELHADCLNTALLPTLHSDEGDKFQRDLHLSSTSDTDEGRPDH